MLNKLLLGTMGFLALFACVAFIVTQKYEIIFGGIILAAFLTFYYIEGNEEAKKIHKTKSRNLPK